MAKQQPYLYLDINSLTGLLNGVALQPEPKCNEVRFTECAKVRDYIVKCYRGNILPFCKETERLLRLEGHKSQLPVLESPEDVDTLLQTLRNITITDQEQNHTTGVVIQMVTRLLVYSLQFRRCVSATPTDRLPSIVSAISDYEDALIDLSNPFTTLPCKVLANDFLAKAQNVLRLPFNPYSNPLDDIKATISGSTPFIVSGGAIQVFDFDVTFIENLYRQSAGQHKSFDQCVHSIESYPQFGFKEYVRHKIPMKRVSNGAYVCYVDPFNSTYYYVTLTLDPLHFKVLKNLLIYEIISGKGAYLHSALRFYMSMCTCEEDFRLMVEYGVIQWKCPTESYATFCENMKELQSIMYCWSFTNTMQWHAEMVKIAHYKDIKNDNSKWNDFALTCYSGGLLKAEVAGALFKSILP